jgi:nucleotide-binding universal stress UspA family protein
MKTIIAATDFTPSSLNACSYAAMLAEKLNCKLTVFNLYDIPVVHSNSGLYFISYENVKKINEERMDKFIKKLGAAYPKLEISALLKTGSFKMEIEEFISKHRVEAVVMGLMAKSKLDKIIYGSHSTDIAGRIKAQVIIVPERYKKHQLKSALLSVDNNEKLYHSSLTTIEAFVANLKINLMILHVRTENEIFIPQQKELKINEKICPINSIKAKDIEKGIISFSKKNKADLIMVLSKDHSVLYDLFAESHTKNIAFASKVPVMAIHE